MQNSKLITGLRRLGKKEMTRFRDFVHSPYFNKHRGVRRLVSYLCDLHPEFPEKKLAPELVYAEVFGEAGYEQSRLAPVLTYTQKLLEQFLVSEGLQQDEESAAFYLLRQLQSRGLLAAYEKLLEQQIRRPTHPQDFYFRYRLYREADDYNTQMEQRRADASLEKKEQFLDLFYFSEKLRDACEWKVRSQILNIGFQIPRLELLLQAVREEEPFFRKHPTLFVYYLIFRMLQRTAASDYQTALAYFQANVQEFRQEETIHLYNYFMNFCIARINEGQGAYLQEIFKLYQVQLAQDILLEDGYLSEWDYKNIVTTGIRLGELDWVRVFIREYRSRLHPDVVNNAYRFNLASYHYAAGQYDEVLDLLIRVEYSDLRYNLGAKALLLRTYFDTGEYEALSSLTESFRQYLQRNRMLSEQRRSGYFNLFRLTKKLAQLKARKDFLPAGKYRTELDRISAELQATPEVFNRSWLEEKLAEGAGTQV